MAVRLAFERMSGPGAASRTGTTPVPAPVAGRSA